jgi:hypothetical protein
VASGAAGRIERPARREGPNQGPDGRFLERDDWVARLVVALRPRLVPKAWIRLTRDLTHREGLVVEELAHLCEAPVCGFIRALVQVPKQGKPFDTHEQVPEAHVASHPQNRNELFGTQATAGTRSQRGSPEGEPWLEPVRLARADPASFHRPRREGAGHINR